MRRGRSSGRGDGKRSEKAIIEALDEGPGTFTEIHERVDMAKSTFNNSLKSLEDKGEVERYYDRDRRIVLIRLSEKMVDPVERTLRHLNNLTFRTLLDLERGRELLSERVVDAIMDISGLVYTLKKTYTPGQPGGMEFVTGREQLKRLSEDSVPPKYFPVFSEYHLVKAVARYDFETRGIKNYIEAPPRIFRHILPLIFFDRPERLRKLRGALKEEKDNPRFYPTRGIVSKENVKEEFEELRLWIRPLLESAGGTQLRRKGEAQLGKEAEEGGTEIEKALEKWSDEINLDRDKLLAGLFKGEQETYLRRPLIPAWTDYIIESLPGRGEKNREH